jgi:hypothetical protein
MAGIISSGLLNLIPGLDTGYATDNIDVRRNQGAGVDNLTNKGFVLEFQSLVAKKSIKFSAFVDMFSDAYNSNWNEETVFGRMDPISTFSSTRRAISAAWKIPANDAADAADNLARVNDLMSFLYPSYSGNEPCATTINMGPLMRVKFGNLISTPTGGALLGYVNGFTVDPIIEDGMFMFESLAAYRQVVGKKPTQAVSGPFYLPKTIRLNFELTVLHEHSLGWTPTGKPRPPHAGNFPYPNPAAIKAPQADAVKATPQGGANTGKRPQPNDPANQKLYTSADMQAFGKQMFESGQRHPGATDLRSSNEGNNVLPGDVDAATGMPLGDDGPGG